MFGIRISHATLYVLVVGVYYCAGLIRDSADSSSWPSSMATAVTAVVLIMQSICNLKFSFGLKLKVDPWPKLWQRQADRVSSVSLSIY